MTISQEQRSTYQATVSQFAHQQDINTCLPVALVNVLDELAESAGEEGLKIDLEQAKEAVDYDPFLGSTTDFLAERLNPHLRDYNYITTEERDLTMDDLNGVIMNSSCSYPIVELDSRYLAWMDDYDSQPGMHGEMQPHTVIPFAFNDENILLFDPMMEYHLSPSEVANSGTQIPKPLFYEFWSGESIPRWTMWIKLQEQQTLDQIDNGGDQE